MLVGLVFLPVLGFEFLNYDDQLNVAGNPYLLRGSLANLFHFWQAPYEKLYIPLTYSVWWLLAQLSQLFPASGAAGLNPLLYHGANLFLHLASVYLCQRVLARLLNSRSAAWSGAMVFALHPLQVEAVAWVTGMKDLLAGFLALLSAYLYLRQDGEERNGWCYGGALLAYGGSLLAKPAGVGLPLALALVAVFWLRRPGRRVLVELLPWLLVAGPVIWITKSGQAEAMGSVAPAFWLRPLLAGDSFSFYLAKLLFPWQLGADYGRTPQWLMSQGSIYLGGAAFHLFLGLAVWKFRRVWLMIPLALFLIPLLPVSGLVSFVHQEISTVADRYLYLAMVGPALFGGWVYRSWPQPGARILFVLLLLLWAGKSMVQVWSWENSLVFNRHTVAVNPRSWTGHANLGGVLHEQGRREEALAELRQALRLAPDHAVAHKNLGVLLEEEGRWAEARNAYREAIRLRPDQAAAVYALGLLEAKQGNLGEAERWLRAAVELRPGSPDFHGNLGVVLHGLGRREEAAAEFNEALRLEPRSAGAHNGLGAISMEEGRLPEALDHFRTALSLEPEMEEAAANLRAALAKQAPVRLSP